MTKNIALMLIMLSGLAAGCGANDVQACYSPTANVSTADQAGAKGCACDSAVDKAVCVEGKALFCDYNHWSFGYDGPCMPMRDAGGSADVTSDLSAGGSPDVTSDLSDVSSPDVTSDLSDVGAEDLTCGKPSCCVPITIDPSRVYVYRNSDGGRVVLVLNLGTPPSSWWDMNIDLLLPSGTSVSCESGLNSPAPDSKTVTIFCPTVALDAMPACDSTITLELRPRSSTYPDSNNAQALCAGTEGRQLKLSVPVICADSCGYPSNGGSCSILGQTCNYSTMGWGGAGGMMVTLPCSCSWNESLNRPAWSCLVP
jgi:hypothetical protein